MTSMITKGRVQKKYWKIPLRWGGGSVPDFPLRKKENTWAWAEFVSWRVDHFSFFFISFPLWGQTLCGKFH